MFLRAARNALTLAMPGGGVVQRGLCIGLFALLLPHSSAVAQATGRATTPALATGSLARAGDAVVTIVAYRDGSNEVVSGIGFRASDGRVVTALRHLRGATRAEVFGANGDLLATVTTMDQAESRLDLAVLPAIVAPGDRISLARRSAALSNRVLLLGSKKGATRPVTERTVTSVEPGDSGRRVLRIGAPITVTTVGAPVVNARGELVGIAVGSIPGRDEGDIVIDVSSVRDLLARPAVRLSFPTRDGAITAARATPTDSRSTGAAARTTEASARTVRPGNSIFPDRYGVPIGVDTAGSYVVELFGCAHLQVRQKVYCYMRVTNNGRGATFEVSGADLADSTRRKTGAAENVIVGETSQRVSGWRTKAKVELRELETARVAFEFPVPTTMSSAVRLMVDVSGEKGLWFGPFVIQRAP